MRLADTAPGLPSVRRAYAVAFLAYSALAIALTFPLVLNLSTVVPHDVGDPLLSTGIFWWNSRVMPFTERWWNGFAFYPAPGFLAFSDPRVGESLLAAPLQWFGRSPIAAYNITFLAMYPLSAIAAHWLGFVLTRRHDAAAVAGLVYGFSPFRVAHIPHIELLAAFGMPAALAALHLFTETRQRRWLWAFALALIVQGFCSSYYLAFFSVLLGLWLLWFVRRRDIAALTGILLAGAGAIVALVPLAVGYSRTHEHYGLERSLNEILTYSADATSLLTAHSSLRLWGWTSRWGKSEAELFPGATILLLVGAGVIVALTRRPARDRLDRLSVWLLPIAGVFAAVAAAGWAFAPWRIEVPGLTMASNAPFKPMTLALVVVFVWVGSASWMRAAYARRSAFAFYTLAAGLLFLCSLGPKPTIAGHQFLYEPPYAWLMHLPMFASVRVPARFWMLVMLALATAGALAFHHLRLRPRTRRLLVLVLAAGIVADGWSSALPLPAIPEMWPAARASGYAAVLELPLGDVLGDLASIYRATRHERPVVNGNSGFEPTHYFALKTALAEHDPTALEWLPPATPVLVVLDKLDRNAAETERFLAQQPHVAALASDQRWGFYALELPANSSTPCSGTAAPITSVQDQRGPVDPGLLTDGNPRTRWFTPQPQRAGDTLVVELARAASPCAVTLGLGEFGNSYPRKLIVETSEDAATWTVVATQRTAGATIRAGLDDPKQVRVRIPLATNRARYLRLRLDEAHIEVPWQITELTVLSE